MSIFAISSPQTVALDGFFLYIENTNYHDIYKQSSSTNSNNIPLSRFTSFLNIQQSVSLHGRGGSDTFWKFMQQNSLLHFYVFLHMVSWDDKLLFHLMCLFFTALKELSYS